LLVSGGKSLNDLSGRIPQDAIASDKIIAGRVEERDSVGIPADVVFLDPVRTATALEPNTEINVSRSGWSSCLV
jgi:hypothetical protein